MSSQSSEQSRVIESILSAAASLLPVNLPAELKTNFMSALAAALDNMDIVTRSEIEVQEAVLLRAREKISELEVRISELESQDR